MPTLIQNSVYVPEKDLYLVSTDPHTPVSVTLDDGLVLTIRGGTEFASREDDYIKLICANRYVEYTLTDEDLFPTVAGMLLWPLDKGVYRPIGESSIQYLSEVLAFPHHDSLAYKVAQHWLDQKTNKGGL